MGGPGSLDKDEGGGDGRGGGGGTQELCCMQHMFQQLQTCKRNMVTGRVVAQLLHQEQKSLREALDEMH